MLLYALVNTYEVPEYIYVLGSLGEKLGWVLYQGVIGLMGLATSLALEKYISVDQKHRCFLLKNRVCTASRLNFNPFLTFVRYRALVYI